MSPNDDQTNAAPSGTGAASGKVILFGEHAVVHGAPALAAGFRPGASARVTPGQRDRLVINGEVVPAEHELLSALSQLRANLSAGPAHCELQVDVPKGAGLGSSAAMAVATARALLRLEKRSIPDRALFEAAQCWERVFHGNPSGVDVAAAQRSGLISFRRGEEPESLVMGRPLHLVIAQAGPPASTKLMVENVARHKERNPAQFQRTMEGITSIVQNAAVILRQGDLQALGKLFDLNHMLLAGWMLSTEDIERAIHLVREAGALGAKVTGAGGGGCIVALAADQEHAEALVRTLQGHDIFSFVTQVGSP